MFSIFLLFESDILNLKTLRCCSTAPPPLLNCRACRALYIRTKYVRSASSSQHEVTENESTRSTKVCD